MGKREIIYLSPPEGDESHFNISLLWRDRVTRQVHTTTFKEESRSRLELSSLCLPALPLAKPAHIVPSLSEVPFHVPSWPASTRANSSGACFAVVCETNALSSRRSVHRHCARSTDTVLCPKIPSVVTTFR